MIDNKDPFEMDDSQGAPEAVADIVATLEIELAAKEAAYLRLAADFDNFKKRTRRDSEQQSKAEKESFIRDLLPILDNLERALGYDPAISSEQLHRGVEMILQQLVRLLLDHGIEAVNDVGMSFDPYRHEAIALRSDPDKPELVIQEVVQRGFKRGDKVFRAAKVIVNTADPSVGVGSVR